jgi:hypothetical protein
MHIPKKLIAMVLCLVLLASNGLSAFASGEPESEEPADTEITDDLDVSLDGEASYEEPAEEDTSTPDEEVKQASQEAAALALSHAQDDEIYMTVETDTYINPIYEDIQLPMDEFSLPLDGTTTTVSAPVDSDYCQTIEEAAVALRDGMENRQETITTTLKSTTEVSYTEIFEKAIEHTGVPTQGDYLRLNYYGYSISIRTITYKNAYYYTFTFTFTYLDSGEEEAAVAVAAEALISSLEPTDNSRYALLCAVYDAVTQTIAYDHEHDDDYLAKYGTYSAAVTKLTVCQGYSSYMYRLLLTLGIPCRCIKGTSPGGSHAWNIVEIGDLYYDLDATWDAGKTSYSYFLKGEEGFAENHTREEACSTDEFMSAYPMSSVDYSADAETHNFVEFSRTEATCTEPGKILYICSNCGQKKDETIDATGHTYGEWTVVTAATCEDTGTEQRICAHDASHVETRTTDALGHDYDSGVVTKEATCKENGVMTYTCKNDSTHMYTEEISNAGIAHTYGTWAVDKAATCTTKGSQSRTCTVCGATETAEIAALGHSYDSGVVTKQATTASTGVKTYTCTRCSASYTETLPQLTPTLSLGDVNGDGEVNLKDVTKLFQYVNKQISSLEHEELSDINHDGAINLKDVTKLFQYVNKQISSL